MSESPSSLKFVLAIDQGTSSTKTIIFDNEGNAVAKGHVDLQTNYFDNGALNFGVLIDGFADINYGLWVNKQLKY